MTKLHNMTAVGSHFAYLATRLLISSSFLHYGFENDTCLDSTLHFLFSFFFYIFFHFISWKWGFGIKSPHENKENQCGNSISKNSQANASDNSFGFFQLSCLVSLVLRTRWFQALGIRTNFAGPFYRFTNIDKKFRNLKIVINHIQARLFSSFKDPRSLGTPLWSQEPLKLAQINFAQQ